MVLKKNCYEKENNLCRVMSMVKRITNFLLEQDERVQAGRTSYIMV